MIGALLAFVVFVGLGYILGYLTKQDDEYERGYFLAEPTGEPRSLIYGRRRKIKEIMIPR